MAQMSVEDAIIRLSKKVVTGVYTGNGDAGSTDTPQTISLGFRPKGVIVISGDCNWYSNNNYGNYYGGISVEGNECTQITLDDDGFVAHGLFVGRAGYHGNYYWLNKNGTIYRYIAFS